jgi:hypothetical protein
MIQTTNLKPSPKKMRVIESLGNDAGLFRVVIAGGFLRPNDAILYGYNNIEGYDPLILKRYLDYLNKSQGTPQFSEAVSVQYVDRLDNNLIRMLNLKYAVQANGKVLELPEALPRAFMVRQAVALPTENALDTMMSDDFDPTKTVVLSPEDEPFMVSEEQEGPFEETCLILHYENESIRVDTSSNQPGYLFLSELLYPGWKALVDGHESPVLRGNYLFRVVPLEEGDHKVEFRFVSWPFRLGLIVSLLTLAGCLSFILWQLLRNARAGHGKPAKPSGPAKGSVQISVQITRRDKK